MKAQHKSAFISLLTELYGLEDFGPQGGGTVLSADEKRKALKRISQQADEQIATLESISKVDLDALTRDLMA